MARTISVGDMDGGGPGGQILYNGLRVRMAISTGMPALTLHRLGNLHQLDSVCNMTMMCNGKNFILVFIRQVHWSPYEGIANRMQILGCNPYKALH